MTTNGRWARFYVAGEQGDPARFYMPVTYHRKSGRVRTSTATCPCGWKFTHSARARQLTVSPKLLAKALRR